MPRIALMMGCLLFAAGNALGQAVEIRPGAARDARMPVAVPKVVAATPALQSIADEMTATLRSDMEFTGVFRVIPESQFPPGFTGFTTDASQINFTSWQATPAELLLYMVISSGPGDRIEAECRLFDIESGVQVVGKQLEGAPGWRRFLAHRFADETLLHVTGVAGVATSQIIFSASTDDPRVKDLYIADYDGAMMRRLTEHNSISINAAVSPDGRRVAYVSFKDRYHFLYVLELETGVSTALSKRVGMNSSPAWHPNGNSLAMVLSKDGNAEIYSINADGSNLQRLTNEPSLDTSPTFSPNGARIAFVSDRFGLPQVCVMNADGSGVTRLSYQGGSAYDPVWSPDGRYIAYVGVRSGEGQQIYMLEVDNPQNYRRLTDARNNESPSWSQDSRHVVFSTTRRGRPELWTVTIETGEERPVPNLNLRAQGPTWGPRRE
jgi:TolB protein